MRSAVLSVLPFILLASHITLRSVEYDPEANTKYISNNTTMLN